MYYFNLFIIIESTDILLYFLLIYLFYFSDSIIFSPSAIWTEQENNPLIGMYFLFILIFGDTFCSFCEMHIINFNISLWTSNYYMAYILDRMIITCD